MKPSAAKRGGARSEVLYGLQHLRNERGPWTNERGANRPRTNANRCVVRPEATGTQWVIRKLIAVTLAASGFCSRSPSSRSRGLRERIARDENASHRNNHNPEILHGFLPFLQQRLCDGSGKICLNYSDIVPPPSRRVNGKREGSASTQLTARCPQRFPFRAYFVPGVAGAAPPAGAGAGVAAPPAGAGSAPAAAGGVAP